MHRALGFAGRAGRVQPEADIVAQSWRGAVRTGHQVGKRWSVGWAFSRNNDGRGPVRDARRLLHAREQGIGDNRRAWLPVAEDMSVVDRLKHGIERNGNNPGFDRTEKARGKVDGIEETQNNALSGLDAKIQENIRAALDAFA